METVEESVRGRERGYFDTFSTCMDPVFFSDVEFFAGENSRSVAPLWLVLLNEPLP